MVRVARLVFVVALALTARGFASDAVTALETPAAATAPELIESALKATLEGDAARRAELIEQALAADPDYAPAHWLKGEVRFEGRWRDLVEVSSEVHGDRRWREYDDLRDDSPDTPEGHQELARWCFRNGLENEERLHWARVLAADPQHELARTRLGVSEFEGGLFTHEQIAAEQKRRQEAAAAAERLGPRFDEICQLALESDPAQRAAALDEIRSMSDAAAIDALEETVLAAAADAPASLARELQLAYLAALANIREHQATLKLLHWSSFDDDSEVRRIAARALRPRPVTDYVPLLMASLAAPIEAKIEYRVDANGNVQYRERLFQAGPEADRLVRRGRDFFATAVRREANPVIQEMQIRAVQGRAIATRNTMRAVAEESRRRVDDANQEAAVRNERVREVLRHALDLDFGGDPRTYWQQWQSHNELSYEDHPVFVANDYQTFVQPIPYMSCFKAGTPVWTQAGLTPIEQIEAGDVVLAQHPATGELAFRPVLQTTFGPPVETIDIALAHEVITATRGHRFWVTGRGWAMAKELEAAATLHALDGPAKVAALTTGERQRCHNLVVDDFHTFFVGESRLLVHDKTCPQPHTSLLPGLKAPDAVASNAILGNVAR